ncbi:TetR/AcrR family transcriptional regulator [Actinomarinicola tropica]|uniref:TetR family transcriptional regulator n=1 Tax=Actinomarinicola tropica TaxID=2789776 RepID=A0A5Q2RAU1_9ACTN|nr:TetR/AcrR family transcriptional regulator [Actinomarinicola tropica]QGG93938.1 TetR family transcriptional regulator [Actinomarinicola tropica]
MSPADAQPSPSATHEECRVFECPEGTDPRIARSRAAVLGATVDLLLEGGIHDVSVDAIAERAGVSKATIYRHWETRQAIIIEALDHMKARHEVPDTGLLRDDLVAMLGQLVAHVASPAASVFASLVGAAEHDPELADMRQAFARARSEPMRGLIVRGIERGELPADVDVEVLLASLVGPIFYLRLARGEAVPGHWPADIVDAVLTAHGSAPSD